MTGQRSQPEELREKLSQLIRYEQQSLPTASLGRIKHLDESSRRATIETTPDGNTLTNVPIAEEFAGDGIGDITPLNPEEHDQPIQGIVLYLHHPLDEQLANGGTNYTGNRDHEEEDAIFLPAMIWFDSDRVPDHEPNERQLRHHDGTGFSMDESRAAMEHPLGALFEALGEPEPEYEDGPFDLPDVEDPAREWGEEFVEDDDANLEWPVAEGETAARMAHPDGPSITAVARGVSIEHGDQPVTAGKMTDGERTPMAGPHQHFHLIEHGNDEFSLAGPQLSFREFIMWFTDDERRDRLRNVEQYAGAQRYAERYLAWLEEELGREIDPSIPGNWPETEPMPTPGEHQSFLGDAAIVPPPATTTTEGVSVTIDATYGTIDWDG